MLRGTTRDPGNTDFLNSNYSVGISDAADPDKGETVSCDGPEQRRLLETELSVAVNDRFVLPRRRDSGSSREWHWKILRMRNSGRGRADDILSHERTGRVDEN